jgi:hypothetical protein
MLTIKIIGVYCLAKGSKKIWKTPKRGNAKQAA